MKKIQNTSILAYEELIESLSFRQIQVLKVLKEIEPANNRMIARFIKNAISSTTPRVYELRKKGLIIKDSIGIDKLTNKHTIFWKTNLR